MAKNQNDKMMTAYQMLARDVKNANRRINRIADTFGVESETYKLAVKKMKEVFGNTYMYEVQQGKSKGQMQVSIGAIHKAIKDKTDLEYSGDRTIFKKIDELRVKQPKTVKTIKENAKDNLAELGLNRNAITTEQAIQHANNLSYFQMELDDVISNYYELDKIMKDQQKLLENAGQGISDEVRNAYDKVQDLLSNGARNEKGQLTDTEQIQDAIDTMKGVIKEIRRIQKVAKDEKKAMADKLVAEQKARGYGRDYIRKK